MQMWWLGKYYRNDKTWYCDLNGAGILKSIKGFLLIGMLKPLVKQYVIGGTWKQYVDSGCDL